MFTFILPINLPPPPDYFTLDEKVCEMAEKKVLVTKHKMRCAVHEREQDQTWN